MPKISWTKLGGVIYGANPQLAAIRVGDADMPDLSEEQLKVMREAFAQQVDADMKRRACPASDTPELKALPGQGRCVGYVVAKRGWSLDINRGRIVSTHDDSVWEPGQPVRAKDEGGHYGMGHGAGIYAMKLDEFAHMRISDGWPTHVFGLVALWGQIKEHEKGYRAEWAYPLEFKRLNINGPLHDSIIAALNREYGCRSHKEEARVHVETADDVQMQQLRAINHFSHHYLTRGP